jgi:2-polyprenyl-3-methyl-5-hydroxy-6-metoxy-1,4-benzoquinol methylase
MPDSSRTNIEAQSSDKVTYIRFYKNDAYLINIEKSYFDKLIKIIDQNVKIDENSTILEIGFNDGVRLKKIAAHYNNAHVMGLEVRQACVDNMVKEGYDCHLVNEEIFDISQKFDVIYGYHLIHHISTPYDYLKHLYSLLKPGGIFVFPSECHSTDLFQLVLTTLTRTWNVEINSLKLSKRKLIKSVKEYADLYHIVYNGPFFLPGFPRLNKIYRFFRFHRLPLLNNIFIFAKKNA